MFRMKNKTLVVGVAVFGVAGCMNSALIPINDADLAPLVSAKATAVAEQIGGDQGFGGMLMSGYLNHSPMNMGFDDADDLANADAGMTIRVQNDATQPATCHVRFVASFEGLDEQGIDVEVPANGEATVQIPCSEIVGMGSLETPGAAAGHFADGQTLDNVMTVPGFLGLDYQCGQMHEFVLTPDVDDLDGDGDTDELIMLSQGMEMHMRDGGPMGHRHGDGMGMMGPHVGQ